MTEKEIIEKVKIDPIFTIEKISLPIAQGFFEFSQATQTLDIHKTNERKIILKGYQNTNKSFIGPGLFIHLLFLLISVMYFITGYKQEIIRISCYQAYLGQSLMIPPLMFLSVFHPWFNGIGWALFFMFFIGISVLFIAKASRFMVKNTNKKMAQFFLTAHYTVSIILFYALGGIQHALVPMVAIPMVYAFGWSLIRRQTLADWRKANPW